MRNHKKDSKIETKPTEAKPAKLKPKSGSAEAASNINQTGSEFVKQLPAIITAAATLLGALITGLIALHQAGLFSFSPTPTLEPSPTWTATLFPTNTLTLTDTPIPTNTPTLTLALTSTETETPTPTTPANIECPWLPSSTLNPSITIGANCLNDLLGLGISETDRILFYRESGMRIGVFGISRKIETGNEFSVDVHIKELTAIRFLVMLSKQERGYQTSIGFRILREGNKRLIQLARYDANGADSVLSETPESSLWNGNLRLTLKINGPQVRAYVNETYFGQTQIEFSDRYLFLGYQVMSGATSKPYINLSVGIP